MALCPFTAADEATTARAEISEKRALGGGGRRFNSEKEGIGLCVRGTGCGIAPTPILDRLCGELSHPQRMGPALQVWVSLLSCTDVARTGQVQPGRVVLRPRAVGGGPGSRSCPTPK